VNILLDTCVISELIKPAPAPIVLAWTGDTPEDVCFLSTITLVRYIQDPCSVDHSGQFLMFAGEQRQRLFMRR